MQPIPKLHPQAKWNVLPQQHGLLVFCTFTEQMCITQGLCLYLSETNAIILAEDKYLDIAREALNQQDRLLTLYMYSTAVKEHAW